MCRHVCNAKVYVQAACCLEWFECAECHDELHPEHRFVMSRVIRLQCKVCRRVFQKDLGSMMESDKFCEQCHQCWSLPGITPESKICEESQKNVAALLAAQLDEAGTKIDEL